MCQSWSGQNAIRDELALMLWLHSPYIKRFSNACVVDVTVCCSAARDDELTHLALAWGRQKRAVQPKLIAGRMGFIRMKHVAARQKLRQKCQEVLQKTPEAGEATIKLLDQKIKPMADGEASGMGDAAVSGLFKPNVLPLVLKMIRHGQPGSIDNPVTVKASWSASMQSMRSSWSTSLYSSASQTPRSYSLSGARIPGRRWPGLWQLSMGTGLTCTASLERWWQGWTPWSAGSLLGMLVVQVLCFIASSMPWKSLTALEAFIAMQLSRTYRGAWDIGCVHLQEMSSIAH